MQGTRCTATQTIKSVYCGLKSRSGPERYAKFHDPIVIEPADSRMATKTGRFKLNGKEYLFEMNVRRAIIVDLVGGLDNDGNCEVGLYEVNGVPLRNQMATAMYEIYIRQEWARANDLTGTIKTPRVPDGHHQGPDSSGLRGGHLRLGPLAGCVT